MVLTLPCFRVLASSLLEQQAPSATNFLPFPHPHSHLHLNPNPNSTLPSTGTPTALSPPPLPPSFTSITALHSLHASSNPITRSDLGFGRTPARPSPPAVFGLSPFGGVAFSTSSNPARRDGPSLLPSQRPGSDLSVSTAGRRTTDNNYYYSTAATSTPTFSHSFNQQTHPSRSSPNTPQFGVPGFPIPSDHHHNDYWQARPQEPNSDDFIEALATGIFSSPSLPPYSPQSPPQLPLHRDSFFDNLDFIPASRPQQLPVLSAYFPPAHGIPEPQRVSVDLAEVDLEEQGGGGNSARGGYADEQKITVDSLRLEMPATRAKRSRAVASPDNSLDGPSTIKRQRTGPARRASRGRPTSSRAQAPCLHRAVSIPDSDDMDSLFGNDEDHIEVYDLTRSEDGVPEELLMPEEDNSIKLAKFECIICMDAAANLTVTHCGMSSRGLAARPSLVYVCEIRN